MESLTAEEREIIKAGSLLTSIKTVRCKKRHVNVGRIRTYCRMRCWRILSDLQIASNLGRIRRLRRIRQIVNSSYFFPLQPLCYPRRGYCIPTCGCSSVIQIALYFVAIVNAAGVTSNGRLEITASAHGFAVLKPS